MNYSLMNHPTTLYYITEKNNDIVVNWTFYYRKETADANANHMNKNGDTSMNVSIVSGIIYDNLVNLFFNFQIYSYTFSNDSQAKRIRLYSCRK